MSHPESCHDPNCTLSYREHLLTVNLSGSALPTRRINRTYEYNEQGDMIGKMPDEPVKQTLIREKRWERDHAAYRRLHAQGYRPRRVDGSRLRELKGETDYDVNNRPVSIDYSDPR